MIESYSPMQVLKICHITQRQLQTWRESGLIVPSIFAGSGTGNHNRYSFSDLVGIRTLVEIRTQGISVQLIRKMADRLREYGGSSWADCFLTFDGHDVIFRHGDELVSLIQHPGQTVFMWVISMGQLEQEVRQAIEKAA